VGTAGEGSALIAVAAWRSRGGGSSGPAESASLPAMSSDLLPPDAIFSSIADQLVSASSDRPIGFESHETRLSLLLDVLLGHARIRGTGRPRDYPFTEARRRSLALGTALTGLEVGTRAMPDCKPGTLVALGSLMVRYQFYDFIAALRLMPLSDTSPGSPDGTTGVQVFGGATVAVLWHLARQLHPMDEKGNLKAEGLRAIERVARVLSLNAAERKAAGFDTGRPEKGVSSWKSPKGTGVGEWIVRAEQLAALAALTASEKPGVLAAMLPPGRITRLNRAHHLAFRAPKRAPLALSPADLEQAQHLCGFFGCKLDVRASGLLTMLAGFASQRVHRLEFQNRNVQSLLNQAKSPFIARGISAWALRATASLRDDLTRLAAEPALRVLSDSDAKTVLVGAPIGRVAAVARAHRLLRPRAEDMLRALPPLADCADAASSDSAYERISPNLYLRASSLTLLELATGSSAFDKEEKAQRAPTRDRLTEPLQEGAFPPREGGSCRGLYGETGVAVPPWYEPTDEKAGGYSPRAWVYSLAGKAWRQSTMEGLVGELQMRLGPEPKILPLSSWKQRMAAAAGLGFEATDFDSLCLLRIDGADVGRRFIEAPPLSRSGLGLELEHSLVQVFVDALCFLFEDWVQKLEGTGLPLIPPIDLLYFGGDDLQVSLPSRLLPAFVAVLKRTLVAQNRMGGTPWKLAAIEYPRPPSARGKSLTEPAKTGVRLESHWAHRNLERLMKAAKSGRPAKSEQVEQLVQELGAPPKAAGWGLPEGATDAELPEDQPSPQDLETYRLVWGPKSDRWPSAFFVRPATAAALEADFGPGTPTAMGSEP
jgi:hypothetical protein